jgi:hypothetical protein
MNAICNSEEIPEDFVLMNDDFFIMKKIDRVENYYGGLLSVRCFEYSQKHARSTYTKRLFQTLKTLKRIGFLSPLDYELHVPMSVQKSKLAKALEYGVLWRSVYGNLYNIGGTEISDVKIYFDGLDQANNVFLNSNNVPFVSTEDRSFSYVKQEYLHKKFPKPSKYEKPGEFYDIQRCKTCGHLL